MRRPRSVFLRSLNPLFGSFIAVPKFSRDSVSCGAGSARLARPKRVPSPRSLADLEALLPFSCTAGSLLLRFLRNCTDPSDVRSLWGLPLGDRARTRLGGRSGTSSGTPPSPLHVAPLQRRYGGSPAIYRSDPPSAPPPCHVPADLITIQQSKNKKIIKN